MMRVFKKAFIFILCSIVTNLGCEFKRDAIGSDNEIRVICSNLDRGNVQVKLADVFEKDEDGISDIRIRKLFEDAGYNVTNIIEYSTVYHTI